MLAWAGDSGILGMVLSTCLLVPIVPSEMGRVSSTAMVTSLALVLLFTSHQARTLPRNPMPVFAYAKKQSSAPLPASAAS